ncbi:tryptophan 7-halogenase [Streptomyces sp. NPDC005648]|uniref:tryptophan 7-halogenase n=1 Tax=Streptomyces sp. NPDC005648 TaxID=3157044 RepID=UPI0033BB9A1E
MSARNPDNVVIVGGGVAGWMAASYLKAAFGDGVSVTLLDPGAADPAEEDEASLGDLGRFFDVLGLAEEDWMAACEATYKLAVRFQGFSRPDHYFYLPFEGAREAGGFPLTEWWPHNGPSGRFDRDCFVAAWLCDAGRSPRAFHSALPGTAPATGPYGYHFKGEALAGYLAGYAVERGVRRLTGEVLEVRLDPRGWIDHVVTAQHGPVHGDLFVDCTGSAGLLLRQALRVPWLSYRNSLPGDAVVALDVPADMKAHGIPPYTTVTARAAGWIRAVPLRSRIVTGYVYAQEYCTPQEAESTLREFAGPEAAGAEAVHAPLATGRSLTAWRHNCVAVAAAAGRVEPLQTTQVSFTHHALEQLVRHFPGADWHPRLREGYNTAVAQELDGAREFLTLLYQGTARDHTQYWRDVKTRPVPDGLAERIEYWRVRLPGAEHLPPYQHGVPAHAYASVLLGTGAIEVRPPAAVVLADEALARAEFATVRRTAQGLVEALPTQYDYLRRISA